MEVQKFIEDIFLTWDKAEDISLSDTMRYIQVYPDQHKVIHIEILQKDEIKIILYDLKSSRLRDFKKLRNAVKPNSLAGNNLSEFAVKFFGNEICRVTAWDQLGTDYTVNNFDDLLSRIQRNFHPTPRTDKPI
jgi:hypothetical protein